MAYHLLLAALVLVGTTACGVRRPVVYQDDHYHQAGEAAAQRAIEECLAKAETDAGKGGPDVSGTAGRVAVGAVGGAAAGAVGGAIWGNPGRGAASGAAAGVVGGLLSALFRKKDPAPVYKAYANQCLAERGYSVVGWR